MTMEDKGRLNIFILYLWPIVYFVLTMIAAILAFAVLEGDAALTARGWFIVAVLVFLVSIPMTRKVK
jgi:uncharacterized membrane protein YtjA (UPF0391 family)